MSTGVRDEWLFQYGARQQCVIMNTPLMEPTTLILRSICREKDL